MKAGIFTTTIKKIVQLTKDTKHFELHFEEGVDFDFSAGQFVSFIVNPPGSEKTIKRPYSIASSPLQKGFIDIVWKRIEGGLVTNYSWDMNEGESLKIQGPLGRFTMKEPYPKRIAFVSTGTGIAPFRSMFHYLLQTKAPVEIFNIFGNRYESDILYQKEFEDLAEKHSNFQNVFTISRPESWQGEKEYVQFLLKKYLKEAQDTHIYICGLSNMITEVQQKAEEMGFSKDQIFFEKYD